MIVGLGTDIVEIERIEATLAKFGQRFVDRILHPSERTTAVDARLLAKRFAAKEAISKALGTGIRWPVVWGQMVVSHDAAGRPALLPDEALKDWLSRRNIVIHLSVADERTVATATAVAETI